MDRRNLTVATALALIVTTASCGGPSADTPADTTETQAEGTGPPGTQEVVTATSPAPATTAGSEAEGEGESEGEGEGDDHISGHFDVGGHKLFLQCSGSGEPTIVYLHGAVHNEGYNPHDRGYHIRNRMGGEPRFCVYDRRNVGRSNTVDAPQHVDDVINDLHTLLDTAEITPPYVLLGASFGGTLSYIYANTYPDQVVGIVMLDSMFPDMMLVEDLAPPEETFEAYHEEDLNESIERISHYEVMTEAATFIGEEPQIPLVYLASEQQPMESEGWPEWDAAIPGLREEFVDRFSPGTLVPVQAPHFMEPAIPDEIADALRDVIAAGARR